MAVDVGEWVELPAIGADLGDRYRFSGSTAGESIFEVSKSDCEVRDGTTRIRVGSKLSNVQFPSKVSHPNNLQKSPEQLAALRKQCLTGTACLPNAAFLGAGVEVCCDDLSVIGVCWGGWMCLPFPPPSSG